MALKEIFFYIFLNVKEKQTIESILSFLKRQ